MELTFEGDTSGITQKGKGPRPTAKDLHEGTLIENFEK